MSRHAPVIEWAFRRIVDVAFMQAYAVDPAAEMLKQASRTLGPRAELLLSPERDEELLQEAGFSEVSLFYAAFTWRGWVANA